MQSTAVSLRPQASSCFRQALAALVLTICLVPGALASNFPFPVARFYHDTRPADPLAFNNGRLGIVLPGYEARHLLVAYRWMSGLRLDSQSAARLLPSPQAIDARNDTAKAVAAWLAGRATVQPQKAAPIEPEKENSQDHSYAPNCASDAFYTAATTLNARHQQYAGDTADLQEWVSGQDSVFSNCDGAGEMPRALPATAAGWLRKDRAYQIAAALFYRGDYPAALSQFAAIARDQQSPWRGTAAYLVARVKVKAALAALDESEAQAGATAGQSSNAAKASPNRTAARRACREAKEALRLLRSDPKLATWQRPAGQLEGYLDARFHPAARLAMLEKALLAPQVNPAIRQEVRDFVFINETQLQAQKTALGLWLNFTNRPGGESPLTFPLKTNPQERWAATHSLPWLWRALQDAVERRAPSRELLAAAAKVPASSPAYLSIQYYRLAGLRQSGRIEAARQLADALLRRPDLDRSARNLILDQRMHLSSGVHALVKDGIRPLVYIDYPDAEALPAVTAKTIQQYVELKWRPELRQPNPSYFTRDTAEVMNRAMPYAMLYDLLAQPMPAYDRRTVALAAWTRGWLLDDTQRPLRLIPYLAPINPEIARLLDRYRRAPDATGRKFLAAMIIMELPGATPFIQDGLGRRSPPDRIGELGARFWVPALVAGQKSGCIRGANADSDDECPATAPDIDPTKVPPFLKGRPWRQARAEGRRMAANGTVVASAGHIVLAWAHAHPTDPLVPQALHLVVRTERFTEFGDCGSATAAHAAFVRLHQGYPGSIWARKTPYWYGGGWRFTIPAPRQSHSDLASCPALKAK